MLPGHAKVPPICLAPPGPNFLDPPLKVEHSDQCKKFKHQRCRLFSMLLWGCLTCIVVVLMTLWWANHALHTLPDCVYNTSQLLCPTWEWKSRSAYCNNASSHTVSVVLQCTDMIGFFLRWIWMLRKTSLPNTFGGQTAVRSTGSVRLFVQSGVFKHDLTEKVFGTAQNCSFKRGVRLIRVFVRRGSTVI